MELPADYTKLTVQERKRVRGEYIAMQNGKCSYCKEDLSASAPKRVTSKKIDWTKFPENFLQYPIHLQHDHSTNMTEGAVHNYCNAVLWQYEGK